MFNTRRRVLHNAECCQGEQGLRKKRKEGRGGEKSTLEGKEGAIDVKRGREEIWKRIREREQLIRWGGSSGTEREKERDGLGQGGTRGEKRRVAALERERTSREEGGKEAECQELG